MKYKPNHKAGKLVKINSYAQGGSVMRSESTEAAKADEEASERSREFYSSRYKREDMSNRRLRPDATEQDEANYRIAEANEARASRRLDNASERAARVRERTGYPDSRLSGTRFYASDRLKRSPVNIGKDDD